MHIMHTNKETMTFKPVVFKTMHRIFCANTVATFYNSTDYRVNQVISVKGILAKFSNFTRLLPKNIGIRY